MSTGTITEQAIEQAEAAVTRWAGEVERAETFTERQWASQHLDRANWELGEVRKKRRLAQQLVDARADAEVDAAKTIGKWRAKLDAADKDVAADVKAHTDTGARLYASVTQRNALVVECIAELDGLGLRVIDGTEPDSGSVRDAVRLAGQWFRRVNTSSVFRTVAARFERAFFGAGVVTRTDWRADALLASVPLPPTVVQPARARPERPEERPGDLVLVKGPNGEAVPRGSLTDRERRQLQL